jgi:hypothetical protein
LGLLFSGLGRVAGSVLTLLAGGKWVFVGRVGWGGVAAAAFGISVPFEKVFEAAGIAAPVHGWTVGRLKSFLDAEGLRKRPREEVQKAILQALSADQAHQIREGLVGPRNAVDQVLARAAQVLGVLTQELGVAVGPSLDEVLLERLELLQVSSERLLLVLTLQSGAVRTIFVEVPSQMAAARGASRRGPERAARRADAAEIRGTLSDRLRDASANAESSELLNIFVQEADELFDVPAAGVGGPFAGGVLLSSAQLLAGRPESHR